MVELTWRNRGIWYVSAGALVALLCAHLESFSFGAAGLLGLLAIAGGLGGAVIALCGLLRGRQAWIVVGLQLAVVPLAASMLGGALARYQQRESFRRGDDIATALASYHEASGSYPNSLSELMPDYLIAVPTSAMGVARRAPFSYSRDMHEGYSLSFAAPAWMVCHRTAQTPWACDD